MNYVVLSFLVLRTKGLAAPLEDASGPREHASSVFEVEDLDEKTSADLLSDLLLELQSQTTAKTTVQSINLVRTTSFLSQTTVETTTAHSVMRVKTTSQATVKTRAAESQTTSTIHSETTVNPTRSAADSQTILSTSTMHPSTLKPTTVESQGRTETKSISTSVITTTGLMSKNVETERPRQDSSREVTLSPDVFASDKQMRDANINDDKEEHSGKQDDFEGVEIRNETRDQGCQPERWCHSTFSNEYHSKKEEECKETFAR